MPTDLADYLYDCQIELLCGQQLEAAGVSENFRLLSNTVLGLPEPCARHPEEGSWNVVSSTAPSPPPRPPPPAPPAPPAPAPWRRDSSCPDGAISGSQHGAQRLYAGDNQKPGGQFSGPWYAAN